jgi:hypothetical protein
VTEIVSDPLATVIRPAALGQESATTLAHELFGLDPDDRFAGALCEASGGNPLYLAARTAVPVREPPVAQTEKSSWLQAVDSCGR